MHPLELAAVLKSMQIVVDSREQPTKQSERRYADFGVPFIRDKLDFGDYSARFERADGEPIELRSVCAVERKMSLDELCGCFTHDRDRFEREFERAKEAGARLYLLIEDASWEMIYNGKYRSKMTPQALVASLLAWTARYNCRILMCKSEMSGRLIRDVLYREAKERLTILE